jgi:hypothetical protein
MMAVVDEALKTPGPVFTEIFTDTKQVWEPKSATKKLADGTLVSPPLEDLAPFLPREELKRNMIIPLIDVKTEKSKVETTFAEISMTTNISKITNLSVNLEFFQRQPVSDVVKPATYHIYFEAEDGERVSNENQYHADSAESNPLNTKAKLRFSFKNRIYSNKDKYYLIIMDEEHNIQLAKIPFTIDIAMANDFGF